MEQTSSAAYPNILVVDYVKKARVASPQVLMKAENYLSVGYQKLLTFERPGGGFDWWGSGEPLVWLSAYGLQEFNDMAKVYPVDRRVIDRTQKWLMKQQAEDGTWSKIGATHGVSIERMGDPKLLLTSYVAWSLLDSMPRTPAWKKSEDYRKLKKSIDFIREQAPKADNAYVLALAANALAAWDAKDDSTFEVLTKVLKKLEAQKQRKPEWKAVCFPAKGQSLAYAREDGLTVETTALAVLAMIKSGQFPASVNEGLTYLLKSKGADGTWGSTQATILALKALVASAGGPAHKGTTPFAIAVNGKEVARGEVTEKNADVLQLFDLRRHLRAGRNEVAIRVKGDTNLTYQVVGRHFRPRKGGKEPARPVLEVDVAYDRTKLSTADLLKAKATVRYHGKEPTYMVIVDLGIPPGFTADRRDGGGEEGAEVQRDGAAGDPVPGRRQAGLGAVLRVLAQAQVPGESQGARRGGLRVLHPVPPGRGQARRPARRREEVGQPPGLDESRTEDRGSRIERQRRPSSSILHPLSSVLDSLLPSGGEELLLQVLAPGQLPVAPAARQLVDARHVQRLAGGQPARPLLDAAAPEQLRQAVGAGQGVGLQLLGDPVAPARGDLVLRRPAAAGPVAPHGVGGHRHQSCSKGTGSPLTWASAFMAARCSASFLLRPQAPA
jgi:hypothetical protein